MFKRSWWKNIKIETHVIVGGRRLGPVWCFYISTFCAAEEAWRGRTARQEQHTAAETPECRRFVLILQWIECTSVFFTMICCTLQIKCINKTTVIIKSTTLHNSVDIIIYARAPGSPVQPATGLRLVCCLAEMTSLPAVGAHM